MAVIGSEVEEVNSLLPLLLPNLIVKKLKCQLVRKSSITDDFVTSFIETLKANELLEVNLLICKICLLPLLNSLNG